jgi:hypothetical protein
VIFDGSIAHQLWRGTSNAQRHRDVERDLDVCLAAHRSAWWAVKDPCRRQAMLATYVSMLLLASVWLGACYHSFPLSKESLAAFDGYHTGVVAHVVDTRGNPRAFGPRDALVVRRGPTTEVLVPAAASYDPASKVLSVRAVRGETMVALAAVDEVRLRRPGLRSGAIAAIAGTTLFAIVLVGILVLKFVP